MLGVLWNAVPRQTTSRRLLREVPLMIHHVPLKRLPDSFAIPKNLQDRFGYDDAKKAVYFDGVMPKLTYDHLRAISSDYDYQRAVEELFRRAVPPTPRSGRQSPLLIVGVAAAVVALAAGLFLWQRTHTENSRPTNAAELTNQLAGE